MHVKKYIKYYKIKKIYKNNIINSIVYLIILSNNRIFLINIYL